jgi:Fe-S cluster assembly scaffold protein SufB
MLDFRLKAYEHFISRPQPTWGSPYLADVDYDNIHYFVRASEKSSTTWDDVPEDIKNTFDKLGIPEAERKFLSGVGAPVRVRGRLPPGARGPREAGRRVHGHGLRPARARGPRPRVLRDDHPRRTTTSSRR